MQPANKHLFLGSCFAYLLIYLFIGRPEKEKKEKEETAPPKEEEKEAEKKKEEEKATETVPDVS